MEKAFEEISERQSLPNGRLGIDGPWGYGKYLYDAYRDVEALVNDKMISSS